MSTPTMLLVTKTGELKTIQHSRERGPDGSMRTVFDPSTLYKKANTSVADGFTVLKTWTCPPHVFGLDAEVTVSLYGKSTGTKNMVSAYEFPQMQVQVYGHGLLVAGQNGCVLSLDAHQWEHVCRHFTDTEVADLKEVDTNTTIGAVGEDSPSPPPPPKRGSSKLTTLNQLQRQKRAKRALSNNTPTSRPFAVKITVGTQTDFDSSSDNSSSDSSNDGEYRCTKVDDNCTVKVTKSKAKPKPVLATFVDEPELQMDEYV